MAKITEATLKNQLKSGNLSPFYLIYGDEDYLIRLYADRIISVADGPFADFNISKFPEATDLTEAVNALCQMPAMGEKRVAAVYNPDTAKLSQKSLDLLEKYLSDPSPTSVLVIYFIGKGIGNSSASKKLTSLATKSGSLLKLDRLSRGDLIKILCKGAANRGSSMSSGVASLLLDYCGDDLNTLNRELEKLRAYAGNRQITDGDIKLLCPKSITEDAFDMVRFINSGDLNGALTVLGRLFAARQDPQAIFGALVYSYINLFRIISAKKSRISLDETAKRFNMKSAYPLTKSRRDAESLGEDKIKQSLLTLDLCDKSLKSSAADSRLLLEETLVKLYGISTGKVSQKSGGTV